MANVAKTRFFYLYSTGVSFLISLVVLSIYPLVIGALLAWGLSTVVGFEPSFGFTLLFAAPIAPYFFGIHADQLENRQKPMR